MALAKQVLKSRPVVKVTFSVPTEAVAEAKKIALIGEFNAWQPEEGIELKKQKDGSFKTTLELASGKEYQFRYLFDGEKWENDWEADKYVYSEVAGGDNSVVVL
jgi:1,4-alpha-glucan branching enzyme